MPLSSKHRRLALVAGFGLVTLFGVLFWLQRSILFPASVARVDQSAGDGIERLQKIWLQIDRGQVEAWFLPGDGVSPEAPGPLVVFAHGNGEAIDHWPAVLRHYREKGISVLLPEYRGYGRSAGSPSESAIVTDFVAVYDLAVARPEVDADRVILHGRSLGGGVVGGLAKQRPAAAMILQSTFTSVANLAWERWFVPGFLILDTFDTVGAVEGFEGPVLIVHGKSDTLIPVEHAQTLHEAAKDSTLVLFEGGHNDTPPSWSELWPEIDGFLGGAGLMP